MEADKKEKIRKAIADDICKSMHYTNGSREIFDCDHRSLLQSSVPPEFAESMAEKWLV